MEPVDRWGRIPSSELRAPGRGHWRAPVLIPVQALTPEEVRNLPD
jgi:hypothetical protein